MIKQPMPIQQSASPHHKRPSILVVSIVSGIVGIGILLVLLFQSLEITVSTNTGEFVETESSAPPIDVAKDDDIPFPITDNHFENGLELPASTPSETGLTANGYGPIIGDIPSNPLLKGGLRVSNQTIHPIRVALLSQAPQNEVEPISAAPLNVDELENAIATSEANQGAYREPVHWDFVPGEGATNGLVLALPDDVLTVRQGDVISAFAQDGSRRYWGPYVVANTNFPQWDANNGEWVLIFRTDPE